MQHSSKCWTFEMVSQNPINNPYFLVFCFLEPLSVKLNEFIIITSIGKGDALNKMNAFAPFTSCHMVLYIFSD